MQDNPPITRVNDPLEHDHLSWPFRPDLIEKELNRLGKLASRPRGNLNANALPMDTAMAGSWVAGATDHMMRPQQWPPAKMLPGSARMSVLTLLAGKAMSLRELVHRSGLPLLVCQPFVFDLQLDKLRLYGTPRPQRFGADISLLKRVVTNVPRWSKRCCTFLKGKPARCKLAQSLQAPFGPASGVYC